MIDIDYIKQLLSIFDESTASDLRLEKDGTSIKLSKTPRREAATQAQMNFPYGMPSALPQQGFSPAATQGQDAQSNDGATAGAPAPKTDEAPDTAHLHEIRSPIVGTFYRSPSPDADPFVESGAEVSPGTVLCIVEAMKLMNEIECDTYGKVVKILVDNAQPVEYNQLLFLVEPE